MQGQVSRRALTSEEFDRDLTKLPERTQANHDEINFHTSSYCYICLLLDEIHLMNLISYSSLMKHMRL